MDRYSYLIRGSIALDEILIHPGSFQASLKPEALSRISVSFGVSEARVEHGGTAGNIAHNGALLGDRPLVCASIGEQDAPSHLARFEAAGLPVEGLHIVEGERSARAWLLTDTSNNQIGAFRPGALATYAPLPEGPLPATCILAPESPAAMAQAFEELIARGVKPLLDPGQALPGLVGLHASGAIDLKALIGASRGLFVNDYEAELLSSALQMPFESLALLPGFCARTLGSKGCELWAQGQMRLIPVCKPDGIIDPTGCGDALRAGFLHGLIRGWELERCAQLGSVMGSFAIERSGGQNHAPTAEAIQARFSAHFGAWPDSPKPATARRPGF